MFVYVNYESKIYSVKYNFIKSKFKELIENPSGTSCIYQPL